MNPRGADTSLTGPGRNLICQVAAWSVMRTGGEELAKLRRNPGEAAGIKLSPSFLKHSDDHTVISLAAVLKALADGKQSFATYRDWGVVAGPKMFGRDMMTWVVTRYLAEGAWGIPPHIIPHGTLHAVSGTISQALSIHGPNMSVSGGPDACAQAFLFAATLLADNNLPGLWLVLSAFEGEKLPDNPACAAMPCRAVALALTLDTASAPGRTLRIELGPNLAGGAALFALPHFCDAIAGEKSGCWRAARSRLRGIERAGEGNVTMDVGITGIGAATPLGSDYQSIADNLLAGRSGIRRVTAFSVADHPSQIAGSFDAIPMPAGYARDQFAAFPAIDRLALWCCCAALRDSGFSPIDGNTRIGLVIGTSAEWVTIWEWDALAGGRLSYEPQEFRRSLSSRVKEQLKLPGPATSLSAACASGNYRPGPGPQLAADGPGRRLPGRCLRHGHDTGDAGRVRQPAGPVAPQR